MENNLPSIHDFDVNLICDYYAGLHRQGPGSLEATLKALSFIPPLPASATIVDLGCGTGGQTMVLAGQTPASIFGFDLFPAFIEAFNRQAAEKGYGDRVVGRIGSMDAPPFDPGSLDLIWCEGAIYNIGFEHGLRLWQPLLKPGGYVAITEAAWLTQERPAEVQAYWDANYPGIDTIPNQLVMLERAGYALEAAFVLPETCWTEQFYQPQVAWQETYLARHAGNPAVEAFIANERQERVLYDRYKAYYGYVFYIAKKRVTL
ncbi:MAG: class I SAM-dependent methyltransferase [Bacteroidales bacterium]|nr:class I SAM-dependent methyltransferase [Bacteroidales bacterium]